MTRPKSFSNSGVHPLRGAQCDASGATYEPREQVVFIYNDMLLSKWGCDMFFSMEEGALQQIINKHWIRGTQGSQHLPSI